MDKKILELLAYLEFIFESTKIDIDILEGSEVVKENILSKYKEATDKINQAVPEDVDLTKYNKLLGNLLKRKK